MRWLLPLRERSAATSPHQLCLTTAGLRNVLKGLMKERQPIRTRVALSTSQGSNERRRVSSQTSEKTRF